MNLVFNNICKSLDNNDKIDWDKQGMRQWVTHTLLFNKPSTIFTYC